MKTDMNTDTENKVRMTFTLSREVEKILRKTSERTHINMSVLVELAVKEYNKEAK